jgi:hypothetical protein
MTPNYDSLFCDLFFNFFFNLKQEFSTSFLFFGQSYSYLNHDYGDDFLKEEGNTFELAKGEEYGILNGSSKNK